MEERVAIQERLEALVAAGAAARALAAVAADAGVGVAVVDKAVRAAAHR